MRNRRLGLYGNADAMIDDANGRPRLTDPMFELWLQRQGLTPGAGEDPPDDEEAVD